MTGRLRKFIIGATAAAVVAVGATVTVSANADDLGAQQGPDGYIHYSWGDAEYSKADKTLAASDRKADGWSVRVSIQKKVNGGWKAVDYVTDKKSDGNAASKHVSPGGGTYRLHMWKVKGNGSTSSHKYSSTFKI